MKIIVKVHKYQLQLGIARFKNAKNMSNQILNQVVTEFIRNFFVYLIFCEIFSILRLAVTKSKI